MNPLYDIARNSLFSEDKDKIKYILTYPSEQRTAARYYSSDYSRKVVLGSGSTFKETQKQLIGCVQSQLKTEEIVRTVHVDRGMLRIEVKTSVPIPVTERPRIDPAIWTDASSLKHADEIIISYDFGHDEKTFDLDRLLFKFKDSVDLSQLVTGIPYQTDGRSQRHNKLWFDGQLPHASSFKSVRKQDPLRNRAFHHQISSLPDCWQKSSTNVEFEYQQNTVTIRTFFIFDDTL
jgi:hypothetical protein